MNITITYQDESVETVAVDRFVVMHLLTKHSPPHRQAALILVVDGKSRRIPFDTVKAVDSQAPPYAPVALGG